MKFRKIFTFILLLCTIFSTLLFINPNVKAVENRDLISLQGSTITFNDFIPQDIFETVTYYIDFYLVSDNSINFNAIAFSTNGSNRLWYGATDILIYDIDHDASSGNWIKPTYKSIVITGGNDVTNMVLISLLQNISTIEDGTYEPEPDPTYIISGQYQFNEEITWLYDTSEQEGILYLPFYVYNLDNSTRVNYNYMLNKNDTDVEINYFFYANETNDGIFTGQYAGTFTTSTNIRMFGDERIIYFYTAEVSEGVYTWLNENGQFINDPTLDPNNPENPDSGNNPNNPNNPDFGTDTVRQIVNQVNAFLGIQIFPGLSFRDILLICIALPLLMYILKVFLGG